MPTRSLRSSVLKWPDAKTVDKAVRQWAQQVAQAHPGTRRIGYYGSYARGDWGVGSDVDLLVIVARSDRPFIERAAAWDATGLPVPADLLVYTEGEWDAMVGQGRFSETVRREVMWVYSAEEKG